MCKSFLNFLVGLRNERKFIFDSEYVLLDLQDH